MNVNDEKQNMEIKEEFSCEEFDVNADGTKSKKVKNAVVNAKNMVKDNGKTAVVNFFMRRLITWVLSAILSATLVLFAQHSFRENFEDYYYNTFESMSEEMGVVCEYILDAENIDFRNAPERYKSGDMYKRARELYMKAAAYSSEEEEINRMHSRFVDVCEDMLRMVSLMSVAANEEQDIEVEFYEEFLVLEAKLMTFKDVSEEICRENDIDVSQFFNKIF